MAQLTSEEIKEQVEEIIDQKLENYFRMSRPGFTIESGGMTGAHGRGEFMMTTDSIQALHFYDQGNCKLISNASTEIVSGFETDPGTPAICLRAKGGNIQFDAKSGNCIIKAIDIKIHATDTIHIQAGDKVKIEAPNVQLEGDTVTGIGILDLSFMGGGDASFYGDTAAEVSDGVDVAANTDIISRLIGITDEIKKLSIFT
tara:strand:- start:868 stop:1470 length:603 start_codon:yes stop_codon:yes gene_type:complete